MLYARRRGLWNVTYAISEGGNDCTTWRPLIKGVGGEFLLDRVEYAVETHSTATQARLALAGEGNTVATATGLGRTPWFVHSGGWDYTFVRSLDRWSEQLLVADGRQVGVVRKVRHGRHRRAEADLPGMPLPVAVFVLAVVLTLWAGSDLTLASALE